MLAIARLSGFRLIPETHRRKMSSKIKPAPLPPGSTIGGYRVVRRLASGGFGVVYLALDAEGKQVAIKEYLPASLATRAPGDRKSTRLDSSHPVNSYAVLCLEKKKEASGQ